MICEECKKEMRILIADALDEYYNPADFYVCTNRECKLCGISVIDNALRRDSSDKG